VPLQLPYDNQCKHGLVHFNDHVHEAVTNMAIIRVVWYAVGSLQVLPEDMVKFMAAIATLDKFTFKELSGEVRSVFDQFIQ
jgi:hypothetical protein